MTAKHLAEVPESQGQKGIVVVTTAARAPVTEAVLAAAGRDRVLDGFF
jgi:hypothetical protein